MIRNINYSILFILFLSAAIGVSAQESLSGKIFKHDGKIETLFDETKNQTTIRLNEMKIFENESEILSMVVVGSFEGKKPGASPSELLFMFNANSKQRRYQVEPQLVITADGEVIRTRQMKNYGSRTENGRIIEPLLTMIPYDIVVKMANAKKVTLKIAATEYEMTANNLEALRDVASRLTP